MLRNGFKMAFFFLAGLSPYLYLPIRSWYEPYLTFFQPLPDWQRFWWNITREAYSNGDQSGTWNDSFLFVVNFFKTLPEEVGWPALILGILGLFLIIQKNEKRCSISIVYAF